VVEDVAHGLVVAVQPEGELRLLARDAIEPLEEVVRVGHAGGQHTGIPTLAPAIGVGRQVDYIKRFNNTFGHLLGDRALAFLEALLATQPADHQHPPLTRPPTTSPSTAPPRTPTAIHR